MEPTLADVYYRVATAQEVSEEDLEKVAILGTKLETDLVHLTDTYKEEFLPYLLTFAEKISSNNDLFKVPCLITSELEGVLHKHVKGTITYKGLIAMLEMTYIAPYVIATDIDTRNELLHMLESVRSVYPYADLVQQADTILEILSKRSDYVAEEQPQQQQPKGVVKQKRYNLRERKGVKYVR